jgi:hypothetical protein
MESARRLGGDEFAVPIPEGFGSSSPVAGGVLHLVAFPRANRYFAVSLFLDDATGPALATDIARQLETRVDDLDARGGPPPWWQIALGVVVVIGLGAAVRWIVRTVMRRNHARDARARGEDPAPVAPSSTTSDPLGFG